MSCYQSNKIKIIDHVNMIQYTRQLLISYHSHKNIHVLPYHIIQVVGKPWKSSRLSFHEKKLPAPHATWFWKLFILIILGILRIRNNLHRVSADEQTCRNILMHETASCHNRMIANRHPGQYCTIGSDHHVRTDPHIA